MKSKDTKMSKSQQEIQFEQQVRNASLNLEAARLELDRTRILLDIATQVHYIETNLGASVRDAALETILRALRPAVQVIQEPETPSLRIVPSDDYQNEGC